MQRVDGGVEEVSLTELFARADEFRTVVGDLPTQTFAIVRLLLAILHRAVDGPAKPEDWAVLWRTPGLPVGDVTEYLGEFRDRFDLLHPRTPFYQVADLRTTKNEVFRLDRLIADVPNGAPYFTTRLKDGLDRISFAEAARWVVHCQAFDPSGIKSGAVGDDRVKNGKGYPIGTGWAGRLGGLFLEGRTLRDTLLLNLVPDTLTDPDRRDVPAWEREEPPTAAEDRATGRPYGPLDLYTWQSRRIRLFADAESVYGVVIANGDRIEPQNRFRKEPMSAWRRSEAQEKKLKAPTVYMPREHDPERSIWHGLEALLPLSAHQLQGSEAARYLTSSILKWIGNAQSDGHVERGYQVRTRAIGMRYGSQQATTAEVVDDAMAMSVVLLQEEDNELGAVAVDASRGAEDGARMLGNLAANLALAAGGDPTAPRARACELAYAELDAPFRRWLTGLGPDSVPGEERQTWHRMARDIVAELGRDLVTRASSAAWVGREVNNRHISTAEADLWFRRELRKTFVLAYESGGSKEPG